MNPRNPSDSWQIQRILPIHAESSVGVLAPTSSFSIFLASLSRRVRFLPCLLVHRFLPKQIETSALTNSLFINPRPPD